MYNPFEEKNDGQTTDVECISRSIKGDAKALEDLVLRHQSWIFNIALNMTGDFDLSQDVTQEVLIKIITKLSSYDPAKAAFRTWLYRIVVNHIINLRESEKERIWSDIAGSRDVSDFMAGVPDTRKSLRPDHAVMACETKTACLRCLLLCLARRDRLVFLLGAVFGVGDAVGSDICGISRVNFRKVLSRSREKVNLFFMNNCSLVRDGNPCRCGERTDLLVGLGMITESGRAASCAAEKNIGDAVGEGLSALEDSYYEFRALFRSQPFYQGPDMGLWLRELLGRSDMSALFSVS